MTNPMPPRKFVEAKSTGTPPGRWFLNMTMHKLVEMPVAYSGQKVPLNGWRIGWYTTSSCVFVYCLWLFLAGWLGDFDEQLVRCTCDRFQKSGF